MMSRALVFVFACIAITNAQLAPHVPGKASPWTWDNCGTKLDRLETDKVSVSGKFIADNKVRPRFARISLPREIDQKVTRACCRSLRHSHTNGWASVMAVSCRERWRSAAPLGPCVHTHRGTKSGLHI